MEQELHETIAATLQNHFWFASPNDLNRFMRLAFKNNSLSVDMIDMIANGLKHGDIFNVGDDDTFRSTEFADYDAEQMSEYYYGRPLN